MHHDSDTRLDRRSLFGILSASPFVFGLSRLPASPASQDKSSSRPAWFRAALDRAKTRGVPVVAFVTPDPKAKERGSVALRRQKSEFSGRLAALYNGVQQATPKPGAGGKGGVCDSNSWFAIKFEDRLARFAVYLQLLLDSKSVDTRELFLDAVCVCAPAAMLGAAANETVVILDGAGKRIGGDIVDLSDETQTAAKLSHLLHKGKKFEDRVAQARTPDIEAALAQLTSADPRVAGKAKALLVENIDRCSAVIVAERRRNAALKDALGSIVAGAYQRAAAKNMQGVLPFGVKYETQMVYDPCPPCGMARVPAGSRKMLKLLDK